MPSCSNNVYSRSAFINFYLLCRRRMLARKKGGGLVLTNLLRYTGLCSWKTTKMHQKNKLYRIAANKSKEIGNQPTQQKWHEKYWCSIFMLLHFIQVTYSDLNVAETRTTTQWHDAVDRWALSMETRASRHWAGFHTISVLYYHLQLHIILKFWLRENNLQQYVALIKLLVLLTAWFQTRTSRTTECFI